MWSLRIIIYRVAVVIALLTIPVYAQAKEEINNGNEPPEPEIETSSRLKESLFDAPATMIVITAEDIKNRGYTNLPEIIKDLPGFDVVVANGTAYIVAYQRGYRTLYTSRTLFMVNGIVENMLWAHEAAISRQYPLSNIKRIEVLNGPASAVYGANAFLGIIHVITYDGQEVKEGEIETTVNLLAGSYQSKGIDATIRGKPNQDISFSISGKFFNSDEPDFSGDFGFLKPEQFANRDIWGPLLDVEHEGEKLGHYADPTEDYSILANLNIKRLQLGLIHWKTKEAKGPYYAADRVQNNAFWNKDSNQIFAKYGDDITDRIKSKSLLLYRNNRRYGYWAEASPAEEKGYSSDVSFTHWNSVNNSWLLRQFLSFQLENNFQILTGFKYEQKELTKNYDIPGYWAPAISTSTLVDNCPIDADVDDCAGIAKSTDTEYIPPQPQFSEMPDFNLEQTRDIGGFLQGIWAINPFRVQGGIRYDKNSVYGDVWNPRLSLIYHFPKRPLTLKLLYGEAFQEPPPLLLWGGWSGRNANPDLKPEKAQNLEFVVMYRTAESSSQLSLYSARYSDVLRESFIFGNVENKGKNTVYGIEFSSEFIFPKKITGYFNYTYTNATSSVHYDPNLEKWIYGEATVGDIAPYKFNLGFNVPLGQQFNLNLSGNYVGERELDGRNPLRWQGQKLDGYFTLDGVMTYRYNADIDISLKVLNILAEDYFHPGVEGANSGNNFTQRSSGFMNSLIPQPGRSLWLNVQKRF